MFKKFLMISLLIPVFSFPSETQMKSKVELIKAYSGRNSSFYWGTVQGLLGGSLLADVAGPRFKMSDNDKFLKGFVGVTLIWYSMSNMLNVFDQQRKINRNSQDLSELQKQLKTSKMSAVEFLVILEWLKDLKEPRANLLERR